MFEMSTLMLDCASCMMHLIFWRRWDISLSFLDLTLHTKGQTLNICPVKAAPNFCISVLLLLLYKEGKYHHLYIKEFIDRNSVICGVSRRHDRFLTVSFLWRINLFY